MLSTVLTLLFLILVSLFSAQKPKEFFASTLSWIVSTLFQRPSRAFPSLLKEKASILTLIYKKRFDPMTQTSSLISSHACSAPTCSKYLWPRAHLHASLWGHSSPRCPLPPSKDLLKYTVSVRSARRPVQAVMLFHLTSLFLPCYSSQHS